MSGSGLLRQFPVAAFCVFAFAQPGAGADDQCPCFTARTVIDTCTGKKIEYTDATKKGAKFIELLCQDRSFWIERQTDGSSVCMIHNETNFEIPVVRKNMPQVEIDDCFKVLRNARKELTP